MINSLFLRKRNLLVLFFMCLFQIGFAQNVKKTVFQAFWWDYWNSNYENSWANYLTDLAPRLKAAGFDAVWIPPVYKNTHTGSVGYSPFDHYDLGDKYQKGSVTTRVGTKDELLRMIAVMHANGIEVIQDVVLNHVDGAGSANGSGGLDPDPLSMANASGYKNFRYSSYTTPGLDESQDDYWTRSGRWCKNYTNFYPNPNNHHHNTNEIDATYWGPDISYENNALGQSSNIPASGNAVIGDATRPYYNPVQTAGFTGYMRDNGRNWLVWLKKQTGVDGWRWDAVKHFPIEVQEDLIYNTKYVADFTSGGQDMYNIAEWVGGKDELDAYVWNVRTPGTVNDVTDERHTGTFDFGLRGFNGDSGAIYRLVYWNGGYNVQNLPGEQQNQRHMDYPGGKRVHRTSPFVNNHDTFRPILDTNGNYTDWNTGDELAAHIEPTEPRLAAAYAAITAVDGAPVYFFEDLFDIGTTGKRWSHLPDDETDLPVRGDLQNIILAHQKLGFKDGDYVVSTHSGNPWVDEGDITDHLVIERRGKAVIGISDSWDTWQKVWVDVGPELIGEHLYDYSGANGLTQHEVYSGGGGTYGRVLISTGNIDHGITGVYGHGYSIWAPAPEGVTFSNVQDMFDYLATYEPPREKSTVQEWEMADDLGDSHCNSLGYGGALPANSTNQRVAGKIYAEAGKSITYIVYPEANGRNLTAFIMDVDGNIVASQSGVSISESPLTLTYTPEETGWYVIKIRYTNNDQPSMKVWCNVEYTAPAEVSTLEESAKPDLRASIWTGNKNTTDISDCGNWEQGRIPDDMSTVIIPAYSYPKPEVNVETKFGKLILSEHASIEINAPIIIENELINYSSPDSLIIKDEGSLVQINDDAVNIGQITYTRSTSPMKPNDYVYISTPVEGAKLGELNGNAHGLPNFYMFYEWNPIGGPNGNYGNWAQRNAGWTMANGLGYIARVPASWPTDTRFMIKFVEEPINGIVDVPIRTGTNTSSGPGPGNTEYTATDDNWNLIGNPYPSAVDAYKFLNLEANNGKFMDGTFRFWTHENGPSTSNPDPFYGSEQASYSSDDYANKNVIGTVPNIVDWDGAIPSGQSFFMLIAGDGVDSHVRFSNSLRISGYNGGFYRPERILNKHRFWLDLISPINGGSQILIGYIENATPGLDVGYEAIKSEGEDLSLYTMIPEYRLFIEARPYPFDENDIVPLGFKTNIIGKHKLSLNSSDEFFAQGNQDIYLKDNLLDYVHLLSESPYEFHSETGTFDDRFEIVYKKETLSSDDQSTPKGILVYKEGQKWVVSSKEENLSKVILYELSGRILFSKDNINEKRFEVPLNQINSRVFILKTETVDGKSLNKKLIK